MYINLNHGTVAICCNLHMYYSSLSHANVQCYVCWTGSLAKYVLYIDCSSH